MDRPWTPRSEEALPAWVPRAWREARASGQWQDWRWQQRMRLRGVDSMLQALGSGFPVSDRIRQGMRRAERESPVATAPYYLALADPTDRRDPILPQVLPDPAEIRADGTPDPFHEEELTIAPGVVHRYPDRALLLLTSFCSTLCRHCMRRREWGGPVRRLGEAEVAAAVDAIAARPAIRDVLLSGGDPLHLPAAYLGRVLGSLRERTDLDCLRLGSRVPVTLPQRVDDELLRVLEPYAPLFLNTHFNHAREVTEEAAAAVARLTRAGVVVSNQAVLLRGVNDTEENLLDLCRALLRGGIRAYYLHHCDPVQGARHFRVGLRRGRELVRRLAGRVSGLALPRFVIDLPGGEGKVQADGPALLRSQKDLHVYLSPLSGREVEVDGSEGTFTGAAAWMVEPSRGQRYPARLPAGATPHTSIARSSNW